MPSLELPSGTLWELTSDSADTCGAAAISALCCDSHVDNVDVSPIAAINASCSFNQEESAGVPSAGLLACEGLPCIPQHVRLWEAMTLNYRNTR